MAQGYTLEQLHALGATPGAAPQNTTPQGGGLSLEQLQKMGATPVAVKPRTPTERAAFKGKLAEENQKYQLEADKAKKEARFVNVVGDTLIHGVKSVGKDIADVMAAPFVQKEVEKTNASKDELIKRHIEQIKKAKAEGRDPSRLIRSLAEQTGRGEITVADVLPTLQKTNAQVAGDFLEMAAEVASVGSIKGVKGTGLTKSFAPTAEEAIAKKAAFRAKPLSGRVTEVAINAGKKALNLAPAGYGFDVSKNLQEGKTGGEAFKPGLGTAISVGIPLGVGAVQAGREVLREAAPRVINSLVKPLSKDFMYGKNPGRAVAEENIKGNSYEDLAKNISTRRSEIGKEIATQGSTLQEKVKLTLKQELDPLDEAMKEAASSNNKTLLQRLQNVKEALKNNLVLSSTLTPGEVIDHGLADNIDDAKKIIASNDIVNLGEKNLDEMTYNDALALKRKIGDVTRWTNEHTDDSVVNRALRKIYGKIKEAMNVAAEKVDPVVAKKLAGLNERYADLTSAEIATKYRDVLTKRQNLISMPATVGGITGVVTAIATGGAAIPAILAGAGAAALDKALSSPFAKTRIASWLAGAPLEEVGNILTKNPAIRSALYKAFKEDVDIAPKIKQFVKNFEELPKEGGFIKNPFGRNLPQAPNAAEPFIKEIKKYKTVQEALPKSILPTEIKEAQVFGSSTKGGEYNDVDVAIFLPENHPSFGKTGSEYNKKVGKIEYHIFPANEYGHEVFDAMLDMKTETGRGKAVKLPKNFFGESNPSQSGKIDKSALGKIAGASGAAAVTALGINKAGEKSGLGTVKYARAEDNSQKKNESIPSAKIDLSSLPKGIDPSKFVAFESKAGVPKNTAQALIGLESSFGADRRSADKGEKKWITGLTRLAIADVEKETGRKVDVNDFHDVIRASLEYFNILQKRNPTLSPAEVYVDKYWTQWKNMPNPQEARKKAIDKFNSLITANA